jgi:superfamily II DNA or RNA helicase
LATLLNGDRLRLVSDIKLEKIDEVYLRVISEDRGILMELSEFFTFYVPGYKFVPAFKNKMWDGKIRLLDLRTNKIYQGLQKYIEQFCAERSYQLEVPIKEEYDSNIDWIDWLPLGKDNCIKPRDYQKDAVKHALVNCNGVLLSPTASGKSLIIYLLIRHFLEYNKKLKVLLIVPTTSLVKQMYGDFADYAQDDETFNPDVCHQIMAGKDKNSDVQVYISTWQSLYKMPKQYFKQFGMVIGDEAHNFKAKSLTSILSKCSNAMYRFGLTGTLDGTQTHQLVLEGLFGPVYNVTSTKKLIDNNHLSDVSIDVILLKHDPVIAKMVCKMKYQDEIDHIVTYAPRNNFIKNLALAQKGNTLVLFQFVHKHGIPLHKLIEDAADPKRSIFFVAGSTDADTREEIRALTERENDAIIVASLGTFSTGINIKNLHNIIFASPSKSQIKILQSVGRVLRKSDNGEPAKVYDIADDFHWMSKKNYTLNHSAERVKIYAKQKFKFKIHEVDMI